MSEFCNQCAKELGLSEGDFKFDRKDSHTGEILVLPEGYGWQELCEGCGPILVDSDGNCMGHCFRPEHTTEALLRVSIKEST